MADQRCSVCGTGEPHKGRRWCKTCISKRRKVYYIANKDRVIAAVKAYAAANKEQVALRKSAWVKANSAYVKEQNRLRHIANREIRLEKSRQNYQQNKKRYREYSAAYRAANKEMVSAQQKKSYLANKEHCKQVKAAYYTSNKEKFRAAALKFIANNPARVALLKQKHQRDNIAKLGDSYVKARIRRQVKFLKGVNLPEQLIEAKRIYLKLKRTLKLATKDRSELEIQMNTYSIYDLEKAIRNVDNMR